MMNGCPLLPFTHFYGPSGVETKPLEEEVMRLINWLRARSEEGSIAAEYGLLIAIIAVGISPVDEIDL